MEKMEILDETSNAVVAKVLSRNYPGLLVQGDTLKIMLDDLIEIQEDVDNGELSSVKTGLSILQEKISDLLSHYEKVLSENGIDLPY